MYLYIDALLRPDWSQQSCTVDYPGVGNTPPYKMNVDAIATATNDGNMEIFDDPDKTKMFTKFAEYIEESRKTVVIGGYVGWYLDQIIIPAICVGMMRYNVRKHLPWLRDLGSKWPPVTGKSIERIFLQGWYPERDSNASTHINLADAIEMCPACKPADEELEELNGLLTQRESEELRVLGVLGPRLLNIARLHAAYDICFWERN